MRTPNTAKIALKLGWWETVFLGGGKPFLEAKLGVVVKNGADFK
jgi:hypothetical protein